MSSPALSVSTFLYVRMLSWYPPSLRAEYGEDMIDVFAQNLEAAWRRASWRGVVRAWMAVLKDIVEVVLPYRTARAIPIFLAVVCSIAVYGAMLVAIAPTRYCFK